MSGLFFKDKMKKLSPKVQDLFEQYQVNEIPVSNTALSQQEKFLHYFCNKFNLQGDVRSANGKFYFSIKHPTFTLESEVMRTDYLEAVNDCVSYCDVMIQAFLNNKEQNGERTT